MASFFLKKQLSREREIHTKLVMTSFRDGAGK